LKCFVLKERGTVDQRTVLKLKRNLLVVKTFLFLFHKWKIKEYTLGRQLVN
jgi:hypothetical protein